MEMPTHEVVHGQAVEEMARFAAYPSIVASFRAHAMLLAENARYAPAMAVRTDAAKFAAGIQRCGYSTNPRYAESLMRLVSEFDLTQYDNPPDVPANAAAA
jgi:flagellar protein FlgJ